MGEILILNTDREGYAIAQIRKTMTVGELRDFLEDFDDDTPIYLSFDNGYTFGGVKAEAFGLLENEEEEDEEYE